MTLLRTIRPDGPSGRIRPHLLRRNGVLEPPSEVPRHDRYHLALAAGWRPVA